MSSDSQATNHAPDASIYIQPDIRRNRVTITVDCPEDAAVSFEIPELGIAHPAQPGKNLIPLEAYDQWTPSTPTLYTLNASVNGETSSIPFAMREYTVKENRFFLNGRPIYIKGFDCTSWLPDTPLDEIPTALDSLKASGFNLIRVAPNALGQELISRASATGMLVEVAFTKRSDTDLIPALRNHASIVAWDALDVKTPDPDAIHAADPSRLVYFREAGTGFSQLRRPYRDDAQDTNFFHAHHTLVARRATTNYFAHIGHGNVISYARALEVSQFPLNASDIDSLNTDIKTRELERLFTDANELAAKSDILRMRTLTRILDALRTNGNVAGYCVAGSVSNDTKRAIALTPLAPHQGRTHLMIQIAQHNLIPRQETPVKVHFLNEDKLEGRADVSLQVVGPTNQVLWKKKRGARLPKSGKLLWEGAIAASGSAGPHKFVVRVMQNMQCIAQASCNFYVYPPAKPWEKAINLLDPNGVYKSSCEELVARFEFAARVHVIPPLGNTIRAYPDNDLAQILGQVQAGSVALFVNPPADWNELAERIDPGILATHRTADDPRACAIDYARLHPAFDELPSRRIMTETYGDLLTTGGFVETSDEDISAALYKSPQASAWASNILVRRYGSGKIVFVSFDLFTSLGSDPVVDHLFVNLLKHFGRRSIPSAEGTLSVHQSSVEWLRQQRKECTRAWSIIGMFPYDPWAATIPTYAPQDTIDPAATYPGWHEAISWKTVHATQNEKYTIDFDAITAPPFTTGPTGDYGIAYAYAEIHGDARGEMRLVPKTTCPVEITFNNALVFSPENEDAEPAIYIKQGKNTVLVKLYKQPGPCRFSLDLEPISIPIKFRWWR